MSCNRCADQATAAMTGVGVSANQGKQVWAHVFDSLGRCGKCGRFMSPRTMVCSGKNCALAKAGKQQRPPVDPWPPEGVRFTTDRSKVGLTEDQRVSLDRLKRRMLHDASRTMLPHGRVVRGSDPELVRDELMGAYRAALDRYAGDLPRDHVEGVLSEVEAMLDDVVAWDLDRQILLGPFEIRLDDDDPKYDYLGIAYSGLGRLAAGGRQITVPPDGKSLKEANVDHLVTSHLPDDAPEDFVNHWRETAEKAWELGERYKQLDARRDEILAAGHHSPEREERAKQMGIAPEVLAANKIPVRPRGDSLEAKLHRKHAVVDAHKRLRGALGDLMQLQRRYENLLADQVDAEVKLERAQRKYREASGPLTKPLEAYSYRTTGRSGRSYGSSRAQRAYDARQELQLAQSVWERVHEGDPVDRAAIKRAQEAVRSAYSVYEQITNSLRPEVEKDLERARKRAEKRTVRKAAQKKKAQKPVSVAARRVPGDGGMLTARWDDLRTGLEGRKDYVMVGEGGVCVEVTTLRQIARLHKGEDFQVGTNRAGQLVIVTDGGTSTYRLNTRRPKPEKTVHRVEFSRVEGAG